MWFSSCIHKTGLENQNLICPCTGSHVSKPVSLHLLTPTKDVNITSNMFWVFSGEYGWACTLLSFCPVLWWASLYSHVLAGFPIAKKCSLLKPILMHCPMHWVRFLGRHGSRGSGDSSVCMHVCQIWGGAIKGCKGRDKGNAWQVSALNSLFLFYQ